MSIIKLRDDQWEKILPFLRDHPRVYVGEVDTCRRFVEASLWWLRTGAQYRELPSERGKWNSVYKRFARWSNRGVWQDMFNYFNDDADLENVLVDSTVVRAHACAAGAPQEEGEATDEALGRSRGGFSTKVHLKVDGLGNPIEIIVTGGHRADISQASALIADGIVGDHFIADKGYDSDALGIDVIACGAIPVIPPRKSRKQPRDYDKERYKERHLVECFIGKLKYYRRVFSRFEKYARHYLSYLHFASALIWLR